MQVSGEVINSISPKLPFAAVSFGSQAEVGDSPEVAKT
jgi:hypothetical protein